MNAPLSSLICLIACFVIRAAKQRVVVAFCNLGQPAGMVGPVNEKQVTCEQAPLVLEGHTQNNHDFALRTDHAVFNRTVGKRISLHSIVSENLGLAQFFTADLQFKIYPGFE